MRRAVITTSVLAAAWGLCSLLCKCDLVPGGLGGPILWLLIPYSLVVVAGGMWEHLPSTYNTVKEAVLTAVVWVLNFRLTKPKPVFEPSMFESDEGCGPVTILPKKSAGSAVLKPELNINPGADNVIETNTPCLNAVRLDLNIDSIPSPLQAGREVIDSRVAANAPAPVAEETNSISAIPKVAEDAPAAELPEADKTHIDDIVSLPRLFPRLPITPTPARRLVINGWRGQVPSQMFFAPVSPSQAADLIRSLNGGLLAGSLLRRAGLISFDDSSSSSRPRARALPDPQELADRIVEIANQECPDRNCLAEALQIAVKNLNCTAQV